MHMYLYLFPHMHVRTYIYIQNSLCLHSRYFLIVRHVQKKKNDAVHDA